MAKFAETIELTDKQKNFITTELRPFLKTNDMLSARKKIIAGYTSEHLIEPADSVDIVGFLLQNLGEELYFRRSKEIFDDEFMDLEELISINIPNGIEIIGDSAFSHCESLESVVIPKSVKYIDHDAFYRCPLESVIIPKGCKLYLDNKDLVFGGHMDTEVTRK